MAECIRYKIERLQKAMSLIDKVMEDFILVDKKSQDDGYGGVEEVWVDGASVKGALVLNSSMQAKIAQKEGVNDVYTLTTKKNVNLAFHQVIKRVSDGQIFRVTSNGNENKTPKTSKIDMRQVSCERWQLT